MSQTTNIGLYNRCGSIKKSGGFHTTQEERGVTALCCWAEVTKLSVSKL
jgi:hypothetical protein